MFKRLFGSYILIILVTVVIMGIMIHVMTERTFSRYLVEQTEMHGRMLPVMLAGHYTRNGGWSDVEQSIEEAAVMIGAQVTLLDSDGRIVTTTWGDGAIPNMSDAVLEDGFPIHTQDRQLLGTVLISREPLQERADEKFLEQVGVGLVVTGLLVSVGALLAGGIFARSISRPLVEMSHASRQISQGNYDIRMKEEGPEEVAALKRAFHQMAAGIRNVEERRRKLVADVSHELRTPLTVIQGYVESLRVGQILDRRSAEMAFQAMHEELKRLLKILDDMRTLTIMDANKLVLHPEAIRVDRLIREVRIRLAPLLQEKQIALQWEDSSETHTLAPLVQVDVERMNQVLYNLLHNAIQHTDPGGMITITVTANATICSISVADNGRGIPREHLPYIFERFYRVDEARSSSKHGGAGIGLSIVKSIVEAHHGHVHVESEPGEGSVFTVTLPLAAAAEPT